MDAVTYPDAAVVAFVNEHMVAVRIPHNTEPLATNYQIRWTPTLITLDQDGKEHHRTVGYLEPEELIASLKLGIAKLHFDAKEYDQAAHDMEAVARDHPTADAAPEALYMLGVSRFEVSHNLKDMGDAYRDLRAKYPGSEWARRASVYSRVA